MIYGFDMPVRVTSSPGEFTWISPTERWQTVETELTSADDFEVDVNFYVESRRVR